MNRPLIQKIVLAIVGVLFLATGYPMIMFLRQPGQEALPMMLSLYVTLGVFLLIAIRNPVAHRSLIGYAAWSSFAHAAVMSTQSLYVPAERVHFLVGSLAFVVIGILLLAVMPSRHETTQASAARA
jgi:ABC-type Fe3+-siderophore transport system permease subunit